MYSSSVVSDSGHYNSLLVHSFAREKKGVQVLQEAAGVLQVEGREGGGDCVRRGTGPANRRVEEERRRDYR